jgi:putative ABC transport system substrate-binding protein
MRRREFITLIGGAAAWPLAARAQQPTIPVVGYLDNGSLEATRENVEAVHRGLSETGYVEGRNLAVEYRWAQDHLERLPALAADLVRRQVNVIVVASVPAVFAAKAATDKIPIVFSIGTDPIDSGLVASLNRPRGNLTGVYNLNTEVVAKRLGLLRELVPSAVRLAVLANPTNARGRSTMFGVLEPAARALGIQIQTYDASTRQEIDAAFAAFVRNKPDALFVAPDAFFYTRRVQLAALAARHALPGAYSVRQYVEAGGLMSYGASLLDMRYQVGVYTGRILKGAKPVDLPVQQPTKFELVINAQIARVLGLTVPPTLLAIADQVIE